MDFYKEFLARKKANRLKWNEIGSVVDKEEGTIRLAFRNKSLKPLEIKALSHKYLSNELPLNDKKHTFNEKEERTLLEITEDYRKIHTDDLVRYILYNQDILMQNPIFKTFIDKMGYKIAIDILEGRLNSK